MFRISTFVFLFALNCIVDKSLSNLVQFPINSNELECAWQVGANEKNLIAMSNKYKCPILQSYFDSNPHIVNLLDIRPVDIPKYDFIANCKFFFRNANDYFVISKREHCLALKPFTIVRLFIKPVIRKENKFNRDDEIQSDNEIDSLEKSIELEDSIEESIEPDHGSINDRSDLFEKSRDFPIENNKDISLKDNNDGFRDSSDEIYFKENNDLINEDKENIKNLRDVRDINDNSDIDDEEEFQNEMMKLESEEDDKTQVKVKENIPSQEDIPKKQENKIHNSEMDMLNKIYNKLFP